MADNDGGEYGCGPGSGAAHPNGHVGAMSYNAVSSGVRVGGGGGGGGGLITPSTEHAVQPAQNAESGVSAPPRATPRPTGPLNRDLREVYPPEPRSVLASKGDLVALRAGAGSAPRVRAANDPFKNAVRALIRAMRDVLAGACRMARVDCEPSGFEFLVILYLVGLIAFGVTGC